MSFGARRPTSTHIGSTNSSLISDSFPEARFSEPISPELVLVDPDLRRAVLARLLEERAVEPTPAPRGVPAQVRALPPPPQSAPEPRKRRRRTGVASPRLLRTPAVVPALVVLGIFIAMGVSEARVSEPTLEPSPPATTRAPRGAVKTSTQPLAPRPRARSNTASPRVPSRGRLSWRRARLAAPGTNGDVERKVLAQIVQAPSGKLPPALIDSKTGLAENGLQAVCRRSLDAGSFVCLVRPARHEPGEGLYVRYRPGTSGRSAFIWGRYRRG